MGKIINSYHDDAYKEDMPGLGELFFNNMKQFGSRIAQVKFIYLSNK